MSDTDVTQKIEDAKDGVGVITTTALHNQLGELTPADWREAAAVFSKTSTDADGFYIEDDNGKVTIHNDLREAKQLASNSVFTETLEDAKWIGGIVAATTSGWFASVASTELLPSEGLAMAPASYGAAFATAGSSAVIAGEVLGAAGAVVVAGDLGRNYFRKSHAQEDIRTAPVLTVDQRSV
jgi:hypothetical protein